MLESSLHKGPTEILSKSERWYRPSTNLDLARSLHDIQPACVVSDGKFMFSGPTPLSKNTVSAYRKCQNTASALLAMKDAIGYAIKRCEVTMTVQAEFSNAYDTVAYETVLNKLYHPVVQSPFWDGSQTTWQVENSLRKSTIEPPNWGYRYAVCSAQCCLIFVPWLSQISPVCRRYHILRRVM